MELDAMKGTGSAQVDIRPIQKVKTAEVPDEQRQKETVPVLKTGVPVFNTGEDALSGEKKEETAEKQLKSAISQVNNKIKMTRTRCEYSSDNALNRISIKMIDEDTGDVIREIPPEDTIRMVEKMWEIAGILVDEKR